MDLNEVDFIPSLIPQEEVGYDKDKRMYLWEKVCETDPGHTKKIKSRGGFTAIDAQYQIQNATERWGPYGVNWGLEDLEWGYIYDGAGAVLEVTLDARFYFPNGAGGIASFPVSNDMQYRVGNETRKKMQTDLTTKALSKLGFNADVFLGMFDDNRYVEKAAGRAAQMEVSKNEERKARLYKETVENLLTELGPIAEEVVKSTHEEMKIKDWRKLKESKARLEFVNRIKAALAATE
jgi:hypothetical protein